MEAVTVIALLVGLLYFALFPWHIVPVLLFPVAFLTSRTYRKEKFAEWSQSRRCVVRDVMIAMGACVFLLLAIFWIAGPPSRKPESPEGITLEVPLGEEGGSVNIRITPEEEKAKEP